MPRVGLPGARRRATILSGYPSKRCRLSAAFRTGAMLALAALQLSALRMEAGTVQVWAWGPNDSGQLGNGLLQDSAIPTQVARPSGWTGRSITRIAGYADSSMALLNDGSLWAWGENGNGQLGINSYADALVPTRVYDPGPWAGKQVRNMAVGRRHGLALLDDGTVWAWGSNGAGALGNGDLLGSGGPTPFAVVILAEWSGRAVLGIAAGELHSLAWLDDGTVWAWGHNGLGQLGNGTQVNAFVATPVTAPPAWSGRAIVDVQAGYSHSMALLDDGSIWTWGDMLGGGAVLGAGTGSGSVVPVPVVRPFAWTGKSVIRISAGREHNFALLNDGSLWAWGSNTEGQLGTGGLLVNPATIPTLVRPNPWIGRSVVDMAAGEYHSVAVLNNGTVWAWGMGTQGQLGNGSSGSFVRSSVPIEVNSPIGRAWSPVQLLAMAAGRHALVLFQEINLAPVANPDNYAVAEDGVLTVPAPGPLANDSDPEGDTLFASVVAAPAHGSLSFGGNGLFIYTPAPNYFGTDSFTYSVVDSVGRTAAATVTLAVNAVNDPPSAVSQQLAMTEDDPLTFVLQGVDADGDVLDYTILSGPRNGSLSGVPPELTYTPALNFYGTDIILFSVSDGTVNSALATMVITVTPVYDPPVGHPLAVSTDEDSSIAIELTGTAVDAPAPQAALTPLRIFDGSDGAYPEAALVQDADGAWYGTTDGAGGPDQGTLFRMNPDGSDFRVLVAFDGSEIRGGAPYGGVTLGTDGMLYGVVYTGGLYGHGAVFRVGRESNAGFELLHSFAGAAEGMNPYAAVIEASDEKLYGTTLYGGSAGQGILFRMDKNGGGFEVLHDFGTDGEVAGVPFGVLLEEADGQLYGTTLSGGAFGGGSVFKIGKDGTGYTVLRSFDGHAGDGIQPYSGVIQASNGMLYGTAFNGAFGGGLGTIYRLQTDGSGYEILHRFGEMAADGKGPNAGLIEYPEGVLLGSATLGGVFGGGTIFRLNLDGSGYRTIRDFDPAEGLGQTPLSTLTLGLDGALYGTAIEGGNGYGSIFKLTEGPASPVSFAVLTGPAHGTLSGTPPHLVYTPHPDYFGPDSFTFTISDGVQTSAPSTVTIEVVDVVMSIASLSPSSAVADGTGRDVTVYGSNFEPDTVVYWNGSPRPTAFDPGFPDQVTVSMLPEDFASVTDLVTVWVRVGEPTGPESNPLPFVIQPGAVNVTVQSSVAAAGQTSIVTVPPASTESAGVSVALDNSGGEPVAVVAAVYEGNPVSASGFQVTEGQFVDVQITGADSDDLAEIYFHYPESIPAEQPIDLTYWDGSNWAPVRSSGNSDPVRDTANHRFIVVFDATSTPGIDALHGTVFGVFDGAPRLGTVAGPLGPVALGTAITIDVPHSVMGDPMKARITVDWDDGQQSAVPPSGAGQAVLTRLYAAPGVYGLTIRVADEFGNSTESRFEYIVIYDPNGGFVTGGGWIHSPGGAYPADPALTGKATFGFVAKHQKGANVPTGNTEFQFKAGQFSFSSTSYDWLVVAGAKAQYKGVGQVNGAGNYGFLLTATDGEVNGGGGIDMFRIKIWDPVSGVVVYDNVAGTSDDLDAANPQAIGGGSIVIHKAK